MNRVSTACQELIEHQRGVLARWQVAGEPADLAAVKSNTRSGKWQPVYRGVYAVPTGSPSREGVLWAGVPRCGPGAALSHFTAAELDGLADARLETTHVTIPTDRRLQLSDDDGGPGIPRIVVHRSARLADATHPAKTPPRTRVAETVLDLVETAHSFDGAFGWLSSACGRRLITPAQLRAATACRAKMRWRGEVLVAIEEIADGVLSNLERGYLRNVERPHRLPKPQRQCRRRQGTRSACPAGSQSRASGGSRNS